MQITPYELENGFLLVVALWSLLVGYDRFPNVQVKGLLFRFNAAFIFFGFMSVTFIQVARTMSGNSGTELESWEYAVMLSISLIASVFIFFLPWISVILSGTYIGLLLGCCLVLAFGSLQTKDSEAAIIEGFGIFGFFLSALLTYKSVLSRAAILLWCGAFFFLISISCRIPSLNVVKPYLVFISDPQEYNQAYECSTVATSSHQAITFLGLSLLIVVCCFIFQVIIQGCLLKEVLKIRKPSFEAKKEIPDIGIKRFVEKIDELYNPNPELQKRINYGEANTVAAFEYETTEEDRAHLEKALLGMKKKISENHEGQFHAIALALKMKPHKVRRKVIKWLSENGGFRHSAFQAGGKYSSMANSPSLSELLQSKWDSYVQRKITIGNDYITLIALPQVFDVSIDLYTSINKEVYHLSLKRDSASISRVEELDIGSHKRNFFEPNSIHDSGSSGDSSYNFDPNEEIISDSESWKKKHGFETDTDFSSDDDRSSSLVRSVPRPVTNVIMYHYGKKNYGPVADYSAPSNDEFDESDWIGREFSSAPLDGPTVMSPEEDGIYRCIQSGSHNLNRISIVLVVVTGIWWIVYMPLWGQDYEWSTEPFGIIGFFLFFIAELINFVLGLFYMANFISPWTRRWKSLDQLKGNIMPRPHVNSMIFHYTEPIEDTKRTLDGCLKMDTIDGKIKHSVYVCDDGHWENDPDEIANSRAANNQPANKPSFFRRLFNCLGCTEAPNNKKEELEHVSPVDVNSRKSIPEKEALGWVKKEFKKRQTPMGKKMIRMIKQTMKEHYESLWNLKNGGAAGGGAAGQHQNNNNHILGNEKGIKIIYYVRLTKQREKGGGKDRSGCLVRRDCAIGSLCYTFQAVLPGEDKDASFNLPRVHLIARLKGVQHHNKAGNINNCIYNEIQPDDDRFLAFFDNDMRPEPAFLIRTLPFFYKYEQNQKNLVINKRVGYVQTPQYFTTETLGPVLDYLASKNSIFFQAIQKGRDGYDACAFAGTDAVFRAGGIKAIGGFPYGSVTEDAYCGRLLHIRGYTSIYAEERLAVGTAPTTPASAMQQRMRWCKGSVQLLILNIFGKPDSAATLFQPGLAPPTEDIREYVRDNSTYIDNLVKKCFSLDTMLYPVSAITAIGYMLVAILFVWTAQSPITFQTNYGYVVFFFTFVPYFISKFLSNLSAYTGKVEWDEIWIAQEVWFSYAFAAMVGIWDAFKERLTGKAGKWGVTGEGGSRNSNLEYFNIFVVVVLAIGIVFRLVHMLFFATSASALVDFGATFFAATIVFQMWPMVSMSLYEMFHNANVEKESQKELHRFKIPTIVTYCVVLIIVITIGAVADNGECFSSTNNNYSANN